LQKAVGGEMMCCCHKEIVAYLKYSNESIFFYIKLLPSNNPNDSFVAQRIFEIQLLFAE
jgi:hypothetical protein